MGKVLIFGSYDVIHPGHRDFFRQAREYGDTLVVVVARDKTIEEVKSQKPKFSEIERLEQLKALDEIDEAILGNPGDKFSIIEEIKPDVICLGYDQTTFADQLESELENRNMKIAIHRLKSHNPEKYKSSLYKKDGS